MGRAKEWFSEAGKWIYAIGAALIAGVGLALTFWMRGRRSGAADERYESTIESINEAEALGDAQRLRDLALRKGRK